MPTAKPYQPTNPIIIQIVNRALASYPTEEDRIPRGPEIIERGGIRFDGLTPLVGIHHYYPLCGHCPCPDAALGNAPGGRCKHRWALAFYRKREAIPICRSRQFYADLQGQPGIASIWEDGDILFQGEDSTILVACEWQDVVLCGPV